MRLVTKIGLLLVLGIAAQAQTVFRGGTFRNVSSGNNFDGSAELPREYIDSSLPSQPGAGTCAATNASELNTCLTNSATNCDTDGYVITLTAGNTFDATSSYFRIPSNDCTTGWVVLKSSALGSLAEGTRVDSGDAANLAKLTNNGASPVLVIADNPSAPPKNIYVAGLEITTDPSSEQINMVTVGDACNIIGGGGCAGGFDDVSDLTSHVTISRSWIHGLDTGSNIRHGVFFQARYFALVDSTVDHIHNLGAGASDSTAVSTTISPGPIKIVNNYLASAGENILFGEVNEVLDFGTCHETLTLAGGCKIPSDIEVRRNVLEKPTAWYGNLGGNTGFKNFFELKSGQRVLFEANILKHHPGLGQQHSIVLTPRNAIINSNPPTCTFCSMFDITIRYNSVSDAVGFVNILGQNYVVGSGGGDWDLSGPTARISIHDNLVDTFYEPSVADWNVVQFDPSSTLSDVSIKHNLLGTDEQYVAQAVAFSTDIGDPAANVSYACNIAPMGTFGIFRSGGLLGQAAIDAEVASGDWTRNVLINWTGIGAGFSQHPTDNFYPDPGSPDAFTDVGFVDYQADGSGNYRLSGSSEYKNGCSDGTDPGPNHDTLESKLSGVEAGTP